MIISIIAVVVDEGDAYLISAAGNHEDQRIITIVHVGVGVSDLDIERFLVVNGNGRHQQILALHQGCRQVTAVITDNRITAAV